MKILFAFFCFFFALEIVNGGVMGKSPNLLPNWKHAGGPEITISIHPSIHFPSMVRLRVAGFGTQR